MRLCQNLCKVRDTINIIVFDYLRLRFFRFLFLFFFGSSLFTFLFALLFALFCLHGFWLSFFFLLGPFSLLSSLLCFESSLCFFIEPSICSLESSFVTSFDKVESLLNLCFEAREFIFIGVLSDLLCKFDSAEFDQLVLTKILFKIFEPFIKFLLNSFVIGIKFRSISVLKTHPGYVMVHTYFSNANNHRFFGAYAWTIRTTSISTCWNFTSKISVNGDLIKPASWTTINLGNVFASLKNKLLCSILFVSFVSISLTYSTIAVL